MNKRQVISVFFLGGILVLSTITSCKKDFLDINQNPNSPPDAGVRELLPSAEAAIAHALGNNFQIYTGLWAQHWTQSPASSQYKVFEQYSPPADRFDDAWKALYADALQDLKAIESKAALGGLSNYTAIAKILQAYTFQLLTDNFGDIPFSEAIQGDANVLSPHYDTQHDIYHGIIELAKSGVASIDESTAAIHPIDDDLFFHGDMSLWRKFGNTLLLRIYLRLSEVDQAEAMSGIVELDSANAEFLGIAEEVRIDYLTSGGNTHPIYSSIVDLGFVQNIVASATCVDYMNSNADPRVDIFYEPLATGVVGIAQGNYQLSASTPVSRPGPVTGANGQDDASQTAPVKLMTGYESMFLQAEAVERGWLTGSSSAQALYEAAITENFEAYGFTPSDATTYYTQPSIDYALAPDKIEAIITQKWVAMCGNQSNEAWNEQRRTGYPTFFTFSPNSIIGANRFPERFTYPTTEVTNNGNFPGQQLIYTKVWWDVN